MFGKRRIATNLDRDSGLFILGRRLCSAMRGRDRGQHTVLGGVNAYPLESLTADRRTDQGDLSQDARGTGATRS